VIPPITKVNIRTVFPKLRLLLTQSVFIEMSQCFFLVFDIQHVLIISFNEAVNDGIRLARLGLANDCCVWTAGEERPNGERFKQANIQKTLFIFQLDECLVSK